MTTIRSNRAITLIELLVVMSIITLLAGMLGTMVPSVLSGMDLERTKANMAKLRAILELYYGDCGQYPDALNHDVGRGGTAMSEGGGGANSCQGEEGNFSELALALGTTCGGWNTPELLNHFKRRELDSAGGIVDAWGRRFGYVSAVKYKKSKMGTTAGEGTTFVNPGKYQLYSAGPDTVTPRDAHNKAGTAEDDLRNW